MDVSKILEVREKLATQGLSKIDYFDVDGTLYRGRLLVDLVHAIIEHCPARAHVRQQIKEKYEQWHRGAMSTQSFHRLILQIVDHGFFVGLPKAEVDRIANEVVRDRCELVYPFTVTLLNLLKLREHPHRSLLVAITGAPEEIARQFCTGYEFDVVISSYYHTDDRGCYTAGRDLDAGMNKAVVVNAITQSCKIHYGGTIGVGNSVADLPFLMRVAYPIAINPDEEMLRVIRGNRRIGYVCDHEQRGVQMFRSDQDGRLVEVGVNAILPPDVADAFPRMPGMISA